MSVPYERPDGLPDFRDPPVDLVRLSIVFEPLSLRVTQLPDILEVWGDEYPVRSERMPDLVQLDAIGGQQPGLRIEFADQPRIPCLRFAAADESRWIELQADRMTCGWSRSGESRYPRYDDLRAKFIGLASDLEELVGAEDISVLQASIEYWNHFELQGSDAMGALAEAYCFTSAGGTFRGVPPLASAGLDLAFSFIHAGTQYAVLNARSHVLAGNEGHSPSQFVLRFSGDPTSSPGAEDRAPFDSIVGILDEGHAAIVNTFASATSSRLHEQWGRYDR